MTVILHCEASNLKCIDFERHTSLIYKLLAAAELAGLGHAYIDENFMKLSLSHDWSIKGKMRAKQ